MPVRVNVPDPDLVMPTVPEPFSITPLKVVDELRLPAFNTADPAAEFVIVPEPEIDPTETV
mgnify:CR=1 FL=1